MKKNIKKTISLFSLIPISFSALIPLVSCNKSSLVEEHIVSINDIHGAFAGYGETVVDVGKSNPGCLRLAREIGKIKKQYPDTLFVSAGDENSGDAWSVCDHAGTAYPILSAMDCRYAAVGNHAFEWGLDDLSSGRYDRLGRTDKTEGNYFVCSNILGTNIYQNKTWCIDPTKAEFVDDFSIWYNQKVTWADPYKIINFNNAKVCLIGLATVNTLIDGNKPITNLFSFIDYNAAVHYTKYLAKQQLGENEFNKIDSFVLLTHCDSDYTDKVLTGEAPKLAAKIDTDIDAIISAHSHKSGCGKIWNNILNKPISIGQAGTAGRYLLDTKLIVDKKAASGKKVKEVSMEVKEIPIPKTFEEAQTEWNELCANSTDPYLSKVAIEYEEQKTVVNEKVSSVLSEMNLDETKQGNTQEVPETKKPYAGYYNSVIHSGVKLGHEYWAPKDILDHFGGWVSRAVMIGYAIHNWQRIIDRETVIPSVAFFTQDSFPSEIKKGEIKLRDMFAIQPYDNYLHLGYLTIMQLANIINYSLAGDPKLAKEQQSHGFDYVEKYKYLPDLHYYVIPTDDGKLVSYQTAFNISQDDVPIIDSGYLCGILNWYGIQVNLVEITKEEYNLTFTNPVTKSLSPVYDKSAKYRVKNIKKTITTKTGTKDVWLPDIHVYNGLGDAEGIKWGNMSDIDKIDDWDGADYWWKHEYVDETGEELQLIPFICNSFNYNGGNTQTKMLKEYAQYCLWNYGYQFYGEDTPETIRDFIITFCQNSYSDTLDWAQYVIPTNIIWDKIKPLVIKPQ